MTLFSVRASRIIVLLSVVAVGVVACSSPETTELPSQDAVAGNLVLVTSNGAWCWYQDERVVVDASEEKIFLASIAHGDGVGGTERNGDVDVSGLDLETGQRRHATLKHALLMGNDVGDDHMTPALWQRPDDRLLAMYAGHNNDFLSRYRLSSRPSSVEDWTPEQTFDWNRRMPGGSGFEVTYSNLLYLADEGRLYNFARNDNRSPNFMVSDDGGESWTYGGKLTYTEEGVGYVNGYFKYATNGSDRIHFVDRDGDPRASHPPPLHQGVQAPRSRGSRPVHTARRTGRVAPPRGPVFIPHLDLAETTA